MPDKPKDQQPVTKAQEAAFEAHRQMVIALVIATAILSTCVGIGLVWSRATQLMAVAAAGALGGLLSALRRLYTFKPIFPANFFRPRAKVDIYLVVYSMIPAVVGTVASVILYALFASGLIKGDLFPAFSQRGEQQLLSLMDVVNRWQPTLAQDYAKGLVWSFVAGFSERFVPDLLAQFARHEPGSGRVGQLNNSDEDRRDTDEPS